MSTIAATLTSALDLLPRRMDSLQARVMLLAIGLQESRLTHRRQMVGNPPRPVGPAAGLWQFERGGGCAGVLSHPASRDLMRWGCHERNAPATSFGLWRALIVDDTLAAIAARLLLWTDSQPLPSERDAGGAWDYYVRVWRPGKPHPATWPANHSLARELVGAM